MLWNDAWSDSSVCEMHALRCEEEWVDGRSLAGEKERRKEGAITQSHDDFWNKGSFITARLSGNQRLRSVIQRANQHTHAHASY